jgi:hypothetical protein
VAKEAEVEAVKEMNYDQQYSTLFNITLWVCKNTQKIFKKKSQISLLYYLTKSLSELSKVVNYPVLVKLLNDGDAMQTIDIDFICFQN